MKANETVRAAAKARGIPLWKIAIQMGVSEPTMIRWLRIPLSSEKEAAILTAIDELAKEAV